MALNLASRAAGRLRRMAQRLRYERVRPGLSAADIAGRIAAERRVDLGGVDGFARFFSAHIASTPRGLWQHAPAPSPAGLDRARRGDVELAGRAVTVGAHTDWHTDPLFGVRWPRRHVESMPYQLPGSDLVALWHLNKTEVLLDWAAAYRATRDPSFAERAYSLMDAWSRANPYLVGANWLSPMEIGIRLVVWSQALAAFDDAPPPPNAVAQSMLEAVVYQAETLAGHFSRWVIPNNHLIGEAAMLFAFASYWPELAASEAWRRQAEEVLRGEADRQVLTDGFQYENSVNYDLYVLDFFLVYLHARALRGETPPDSIRDKVAAMAGAVVTLPSASGRLPMIGDDSIDRFFAIDMDAEGAWEGNRVEFARFVRPAYRGLFSTVAWGRELLGVTAPLAASVHLHDAGITVVRDEHAHLVFTHGPQHRHLFAHGHLHADMAHVTLELDGSPILIDSGTYLYSGDRGVRNHFKGGRAHNAPIIDGLEPMESADMFSWASVNPGEYLGHGTVRDLAGVGCRRRTVGAGHVPFEHTRAVARSGDVVMVIDVLRRRAGAAASGPTHSAIVLFHTPMLPGTVTVGGNHARLSDPRRFFRVLEAHADRDVRVDLIDGDDDWACRYSPRYGEVRRGVTVRVAAEFEETLALVTVIRPLETAVSPLALGTGEISLAVEVHGARRIVTVRTDPFAVEIGGYILVGRERPDRVPVRGASPPRQTDMTWLDELS